MAVFCRSEVAADPAGVGEECGPWPTGEGGRLPTARVRLLKSLGRFPWPRISLPANRLAVARASWRRRVLEDEAVDELALLQEAGGKRWRLVGTYGGRGALRTPACRQEL